MLKLKYGAKLIQENTKDTRNYYSKPTPEEDILYVLMYGEVEV